MAFTDEETVSHLKTLEDRFWSQHRPPARLRDKIRDGQRLEGQSVELFYIRPHFSHSGQWIEESIAKITYVRKSNAWKIYWQRADGKWHRYPPHPEAKSLSAALEIINEDAKACFFG